MRFRRVVGGIAGLIGLGLLGCGQVEAAPLDDEADPVPGLFATYGTVTRIDPDLSWNWGPGAPDVRLPADGFEARWTGRLLIQSPGPHRFFVRTDGRAELKAGDRTILKPPASESDSIELPAGFLPIVVSYRHDQGDAHLAVDWEGPGFRREPLPARLLFHDQTAPSPDEFELGRRLADRLGCANCHSVLDLPAHPGIGPPLTDAGRAIAPGWLTAWLADPALRRPHSRMPGFGFQDRDVADLTAFLVSVIPKSTESLTNELRMALNVSSPEQGRLLFRSLGCLGCHVRDGADGARPVDPAGPDLSDLGRKRGIDWLTAYLVQPKGKPARHRADLKVTPEEAAHLAVFLVADSLQSLINEKLPFGDPMRGRALAEHARCASCHEIPGLKPQRVDRPLRAGTRPDGGCLASQPTTAPRFALTDSDRQALRALVAGLPAAPSPTSPETLARDAIRRRNCLGCHTRDGQGGADLGAQVAALLGDDPALGGRKGTLTPPNLTAVGDKLRPDYLAEAVRGSAPTARPWLSVRMPAFTFEAGEADAIATFFQQHDRMRTGPDEPDSPAATVPLETAANLIGQRGFGCVSCHVLAGRIPPGGEPETLGPDLTLAHRRMTERYFVRWIANPQRIVAGTPMPQFLQPVANVPGTLDDQLATIWQFLGSPKAADAAAFGTRSILQRQGDRALVVLDMVLLPDAPDTPYTPRGLAIGLVNGQSLLFDTDRLTWLAWWHKGFLSRTKAGRLWEWHPEGDRLWTASARLAPIVLVEGKDKVVPPTEVRERFGHFREVEFEGTGVALSYDLNFPGATVSVRERIQPIADGWERTVAVERVPEGIRPALVEAVGKAPFTLQTLETTAEPAALGKPPDARLLGMVPRDAHSYQARLRLTVKRQP